MIDLSNVKVSKDFPPNYQKIIATFNLGNWKPVFAYGETIYNPFNIFIDDFLLAHEIVHLNRQKRASDWWDSYLLNPDFRKNEEILASRVQYQLFCQFNKDRNERFRYLHSVATELSSQLYGNMIDYTRARNLITQ